MREFRGTPNPTFAASARAKGDSLEITFTNNTSQPLKVTLEDLSYSKVKRTIDLPGKQWYDLKASETLSSYHFAGRIETGAWAITDPAMAK